MATQILLRVRAKSDAVLRAQAKLEAVVAERDEAICEATRQGFSLRAVGDAAGLSHEHVRRIVSRA